MPIDWDIIFAASSADNKPTPGYVLYDLAQKSGDLLPGEVKEVTAFFIERLESDNCHTKLKALFAIKALMRQSTFQREIRNYMGVLFDASILRGPPAGIYGDEQYRLVRQMADKILDLMADGPPDAVERISGRIQGFGNHVAVQRRPARKEESMDAVWESVEDVGSQVKSITGSAIGYAKAFFTAEAAVPTEIVQASSDSVYVPPLIPEVPVVEEPLLPEPEPLIALSERSELTENEAQHIAECCSRSGMRMAPCENEVAAFKEHTAEWPAKAVASALLDNINAAASRRLADALRPLTFFAAWVHDRPQVVRDLDWEAPLKKLEASPSLLLRQRAGALRDLLWAA